MYDIITFGSATRDIFLRAKNFKVINQKKFLTGSGLCFTLGSKIEVEDIYFSSGGGGTNTAATFARQGFKTAYCGMVGDDISGKEIIKELQDFKIDTKLVLASAKAPTSHSVVLSSDGDDRTILVYRGAAGFLKEEDIPWQKLKAKVFYLATLSGHLCGLFDDLVNFAKKKGIKVAVNPGNCQLSMQKEKLEKILKKVDILILNQEEASLLAKVPFQEESEIFRKIDDMCDGIVIMTKGPDGVVVSDGQNLYRAKSLPVRVIDRTGAGDSFASGFVSAYFKDEGNIENAIQLGIANSIACITSLGAKQGLLKKGEKFKKVEVLKESCGFQNNCKCK